MAGREVKTITRTTDGVIVARRTRLKGVHFINTVGAGTAAIVYDNASAASGTAVLTIPALAAGQDYLSFGEGILATNGLFLDINGIASVVAVYE